MTEILDCPKCLKVPALCVCGSIRPQKTRLHVLILQHPQEPDKDLGSARLSHLALPNSTLRIGLSWPNIKSALGPNYTKDIVPSRWAVLYLGSGAKKSNHWSKSTPIGSHTTDPKSWLQFVDKKGIELTEEIRPRDLDGIVLIDGTWSQAKALWWRNAWLLKLKRAILHAKDKSLYKELRREPRRECLSTIETVAETLSVLGESPAAGVELKRIFSELLDKKRAQKKTRKPEATQDIK